MRSTPVGVRPRSWPPGAADSRDRERGPRSWIRSSSMVFTCDNCPEPATVHCFAHKQSLCAACDSRCERCTITPNSCHTGLIEYMTCCAGCTRRSQHIVAARDGTFPSAPIVQAQPRHLGDWLWYHPQLVTLVLLYLRLAQSLLRPLWSSVAGSESALVRPRIVTLYEISPYPVVRLAYFTWLWIIEPTCKQHAMTCD